MKPSFALFFVLILPLSLYSQTPKFKWVNTSGAAGPEIGTSVALDKQGNIYNTGYFVGAVDFDPGPGVVILSTTSNENINIFIQKLDGDGNLIWAKDFGPNSVSHEGANSPRIKSDSNGAIYIAGKFWGMVDFDPGLGEFKVSAQGYEDIFILKLDSSGSFISVKTMGGKNEGDTYASVRPGDFEIDREGNIYITGHFAWNIDFDPGAGEFYMKAGGPWPKDYADGFVEKLDKDGNFVWAYQIGSPDFSDFAQRLAFDSEQNLIVTGWFGDTVDFDPSANTFELSSNEKNVFVQKVTKDGEFLWAKHIGNPDAFMSVYALVVDEKQNILMGGQYFPETDFDPGPGTYELESDTLNSYPNEDMYLLKLDQAGNFIWAKGFAGYFEEQVTSLACDHNNSIYVLGVTSTGDLDVDPGPRKYKLKGCPTFLLKLSPEGNFIQAGGVQAVDSANNADGFSIALDSNKNVLVSGMFNGVYDFDPGGGQAIKTTSGSLYPDYFLFKWATCEGSTSGEHQIIACTQYTLPSGRRTYSKSGTYLDTIANAKGCDSILTIHLTIIPPTTATIEVKECRSYTVPSGKRIYIESGTYTDTIPNSMGCDSILTINLTIIKIDTSVTLTGHTITSGQKDASYQWLDCSTNSSPLSGEIHQSFTPSASGSYAVEVSKENCKDTSTCISVTYTEIGELSPDDRFHIYPNPANRIFYISFSDPLHQEPVTLTLFNSTGKLILRKTIPGSANNRHKLDLSALPAAAYFIVVSSENYSAIKKLIIKNN